VALDDKISKFSKNRLKKENLMSYCREEISTISPVDIKINIYTSKEVYFKK
jgi:hypothetical protein